MTSIVRAIEIWEPAPYGVHLELRQRFHEASSQFEEASQSIRFAKGEGLPGRAWSAGAPIMINTVTANFFKRTRAALFDGLASGIAIPYSAGGVLRAVVTMFFGSTKACDSAVELWAEDGDTGSPRIVLQEAYFGAAEIAEWSDDRVEFSAAFGQPDLALSTSLDVGQGVVGTAIARWEPAVERGLAGRLGCAQVPDDVAMSVAAPVAAFDARRFAACFIFSKSNPMARSLKIWRRVGEDSFDTSFLHAFAPITGGDNSMVAFDAFKKGAPQLKCRNSKRNRGWTLALPVLDREGNATHVVVLRN